MSEMNQERILNTVRECVADIVGVNQSLVLPDATLADVGVDSLAKLELGFRLELHFGISLSIAVEEENKVTIKALAEMISAATSVVPPSVGAPVEER